MTWNGKGGFNRNHNFSADAHAGPPHNIISSHKMDDEFYNLQGGLEHCLTKDGQNSPSQALPMNGHNHTDVGDANLGNQYSSAQQVQNGSLIHLTHITGTNALAATAPLAMQHYHKGQLFTFKATADNTGPVSININHIGDTIICKEVDQPLEALDLRKDAMVVILYNGDCFQYLNPGSDVTRNMLGQLAFADHIDTTTWNGAPLTVENGGSGASNAQDARNNLGLGSAATHDTGTDANQVVTLDNAGRLPNIDASQLFNVAAGVVNVRTYHEDTVWHKPDGVSKVFVIAIGAGGGGGSASDSGGGSNTGYDGGTTHFGNHLHASGGAGGKAQDGAGNGGIANQGLGTGGNLNMGATVSRYTPLLTHDGAGGNGGKGVAAKGGDGGGGGISLGLILEPADFETISIGKGGARGEGSYPGNRGTDGCVILYEIR